MPYFVAEKLMRLMLEKGIQIKGSDVLILGATFKENTPDTRNSKVPLIVEELKKNGVKVYVFDPLVPEFSKEPKNSSFDVALTLVQHEIMNKINLSYYLKSNKDSLILEIRKSIL